MANVKVSDITPPERTMEESRAFQKMVQRGLRGSSATASAETLPVQAPSLKSVNVPEELVIPSNLPSRPSPSLASSDQVSGATPRASRLRACSWTSAQERQWYFEYQYEVVMLQDLEDFSDYFARLERRRLEEARAAIALQESSCRPRPKRKWSSHGE
ncbi:MAG: hypothetical protein M1835_003398 [Candelina submexicana]|nr:MAG: hypothetical protein M1835_003398 [Candelina submexicana]